MREFLIIITALFSCLAFVLTFVYLVIDFDNNWAVSSNLKKFLKKNYLYECTGCDRLHRNYQRFLVKSAKGYESCPHCGSSGKYGINAIDKPDKWMNTHPDCLKIKLPSYLKILRAMKTAERLKREQEEIKRFEKYNNLEPNIDWIIKLQKDLSN